MKILQILLSQSEAGAETYFEKVAAEFERRTEIQQRLIIEALPSRERRLGQVGCSFDTLPMDWFGKRVHYDRRLRKAARTFDPDILLTWVNRASRKAPPVRGVTVGRLGGYYDIGNYTRCDHLIVNTPDLVRHVVEAGWPETAVSMISNFGDLPDGLQTPAEIPWIPEGAPVLLTLGRLHPKKAQDTLIRAMPLLEEAHLLIAGDGELRAGLEALAASEGVSSRVHFLGLRKDIAALYRRADVCVFPSRFEPLGNVVLEAWATHVPIVAAASTGPKWLIEHGRDGMLFAIDDHRQLAEQVRELLRDPVLRATLVEAGAAKLEASFSRRAIIDQYLALFRGLLDGRIGRST